MTILLNKKLLNKIRIELSLNHSIGLGISIGKPYIHGGEKLYIYLEALFINFRIGILKQ